MRLLELLDIVERRTDAWLADVIYDQLVRGDWTDDSGYQSESLLDEIEAETGIDLNDIHDDPSLKPRILDFIQSRYLSGRMGGYWTPELKAQIEAFRKGGPIEIYRGMSVRYSELDAITNPDSMGRGYGNVLPIGKFWTWDFQMAVEMSGGRGQSVVLHALIDPSNVNWAHTMAANAIWGEREIRPEYQAELKLVNVLDTKKNAIAEPNPEMQYIAEANERGDTIPNPLPFLPVNDPRFSDWFDRYDNAVAGSMGQHDPLDYAGAFKSTLDALADEEDIPIDKLLATEPVVSKDAVYGSADRKASSRLPIIAKVDGTLFIVDGNHRVVRAHLAGDSHVRALFIDVDSLEGAMAA